MRFLIYFVFLFIISCSTNKNKYDNKLIGLNGSPLNFFKYPFFNLKINDSLKGNFIFDTGCYNTFLDSTFIINSKLKINYSKDASSSGIGTLKKKIKVSEDTLKFQFEKTILSSSPNAISDIKSIAGRNCDGLIGYRYFEKKIVKLDYRNEQCAIYSNTNDILDITEYFKVPIDFKKNRIFLNASITINDTIQINGKFILDTGSNFPIYLTSTAAQKYKLKNITYNSDFISNKTGTGGNANGYTFLSKSILIGNCEFNKVPIYASTDSAGSMATNDFEGILGNQFLENFTFIINPIKKELLLKPYKKNAEFDYNLLGFTLIDRTDIAPYYWGIKALLSKSIAENSGLTLNDKITKINNKNVVKINLKQFLKDLRVGENIDITVLKNNKEHVYPLILKSVYK